MAIPLLAALLTFQANDVKVYENKPTDLKFNYPAEWKLKKDRLYDEFTFQIDGKAVSVQVMVTEMNYPKDHWQEVNKEVNQNNNREVLRQWEEELLGVPLLLIRVRDSHKAEPQIIVTGLLYGARQQKMLFRLYAPEGIAPQAESTWTNVLLSANTVSGILPGEANPTGTTQVPVNTNQDVKVSVITPPTSKPEKPIRGDGKVKIDESSGLMMFFPTAWSYKDGELSRPETKVKVTYGIGDDRAARSAWLKVCGTALGRISKVNSRTESELKFTRAGFNGSVLNRTGSAGDLEERQWIVYGWSGGYYYTLEWIGSQLEFDKVKDALAELYQLSAVAPE